MTTIAQKLGELQKKLKVPKSEFNKFGGFKYRKLDQIFESLKPYLGDLAVSIDYDVVEKGNRFYVKATATITDGTASISASAFAREPESKKGMDDAQVTGTSQTYAAKTALGALLLLDDSQDPDDPKGDGEEHKEAVKTLEPAKKQESQEPKKASGTSFRRTPVKQQEESDDGI